jgi:serpin B
VASILLLAGCDPTTGPPGPPETIDALPRQLTDGEQELIGASNTFGFHLLRELQAEQPEGGTEPENIFISPLSASLALGMAMNGADGRTFGAMRSTLGFGDADLATINESYAGLIELLRGLDPRVEFLLANSVWLQEGWPFLADYRSRVTETFDARLENVDFTDPATADAINGWVSDGTDGKIEELVTPDMIRDLVALLANTVYFKGEWTDRFDESETSDADFRVADGSTVTVPMMRQEMEGVARARREGFSAADLPYGGGAFSMTVVLPAEGTSLDSLVAAMDAGEWRSLVDQLGEGQSVQVEMPRFEIEYEKVLNRPLQRMGMRPAFSTDSADFSRMAETPPCTSGTDPCLYVDWVKQKSFVQVNEEGTEAAAATGVGVGVTSAPPSFRVDRPFLFAIRERLSGTVLFVGTVMDPTAG